MIAFDAQPGLGQVQARAPVLGVAADPYYSEDLAGHGHFSLVFTQAASYLDPFRTAA